MNPLFYQSAPVRSYAAARLGFAIEPTLPPSSAWLWTSSARGARPEYVRQACDNSLRRLGNDHIDLYQVQKSIG